MIGTLFKYRYMSGHPRTRIQTFRENYQPLISNCVMQIKSPSGFLCKNQAFELNEVGFWDIRYLQKGFRERVIVQRDWKKLQIHEVGLEAKGFKGLEDNLERYRGLGVNCLYIMGGLERDNGQYKNNKYERQEASPLAVVDRTKASKMLGGGTYYNIDAAINNMIKLAKQKNIKVVLDCLTRVSSSRPSKKYRDKFVHTLDEQGKVQICYGTDGKSLQYEETALLNYRRLDVWDLLIQEALTLIEKYDIDGVHLDNCQTWPNIMSLDLKELYRKESDGESAYSNAQIFEGSIVTDDQHSGYWTSKAKHEYPNPFLVKFCQKLWQKHSKFIIIAEVWNSHNDEFREINIIKSGPIPRVYFMPVYFASIFGKKLSINGEVKNVKKQDVHMFKNWYERSLSSRPLGSFVIQSSTSHSWPYPALLYKKGTWPAVDVFFMLPDPPMTFIGEHDGHSYRTKTINMFQKVTETKVPPVLSKVSMSFDDVNNLVPENHSDNEFYQDNSPLVDPKIDKLIFQDEDDLIPQELRMSKNKKTGMFRVTSHTSVSVLENQEQIKIMEDQIKKEIDHKQGFDITQIKEHYKHRRLLRSEHRVLTHGQMLSLTAEHENGQHDLVLVFARYTQDEIAIVAANFNSQEVNCHLNLKPLKYIFTNPDSTLQTFELSNLLNPHQKKQLFTVYSLVNSQLHYKIGAYKSQILLFKQKKMTQEEIMSAAMKDIKYCIQNNMQIKASPVVQEFIQIIKKDDFSSFIYESNNLFKRLQKFSIDWQQILPRAKEILPYANKLMAFSRMMKEKKLDLPFKDWFSQMEEKNRMKSICFTTPELGRWSTVGGLGVMVDELSQGLAALDEKVIVISPYYHRNKKDQTDYLEKALFTHINSIKIQVGNDWTEFGVHYGVVNKVHLYFLHNEEIFPKPYADGEPWYTMKQMVSFGKGCLELLCQIQTIPPLIVTNDWFTGLTAAYAKNKHFGSVFDSTKFFHIVHNLDPSYEGRLPLFQGNLWMIHQLPCEQLIDPYWETPYLNPSRCALLNSDQWGTVSISYRAQLYQSSPLAPLLALHPRPFAFPNGIRKAQRQDLLNPFQHNHYLMKSDLQQKYFRFKDSNCCMLAFIGRITEQKGVHLILESLYELLPAKLHCLQVLIGGQASLQDPYGAHCVRMLLDLMHRYPNNVWGAPTEFFYDGPKVNLGADFALMPSRFEPGGIVQHEFFVAGTPVLAHRTGGLKDTVIEYKDRKGSGVVFEEFSKHSFKQAVERALGIFAKRDEYEQLRQNCLEAVIDVDDVAKAWNKEFHFVNNQIFTDQASIAQWQQKIDSNYDCNYVPEETEDAKEDRILTEQDINIQKFHNSFTCQHQKNDKLIHFSIKIEKAIKPKTVLVVGSWYNWSTRHYLSFDSFSLRWVIDIRLSPGQYQQKNQISYKYLVNDEWTYDNDEPKHTDEKGNVNNFLIII